MRIHYLSSSIIPSPFANSVHVMKMCDALTRRGGEVVLYARRGPAGVDANRYYGTTSKFELVLSWCSGFRGGVLLHSPQVVLEARGRSKPDLFYGRDLFAMRLLAHSNVPLMYEVHEPPHTSLGRAVLGDLIRHPNFLGLVSITHALLEEHHSLYPQLRSEQCLVLPDGADVLPANALDCQEREHAADRPLTVGYVGSLYDGRGVEIIAELARRLPHLPFEVVGGPTKAVEEWQKRTSDCRNLRFLGYVPHSETTRYMRRFDIVLAPYQRRVGLAKGGDIGRWLSPMKLFEYMAHQRAIVCSDLPVLREVLAHEQTCLFVPPDRVPDWVFAVQRLASDHALRRSIGSRAGERLAKEYSWDKRADRVLDFARARLEPADDSRAGAP